MKKVFLSIVLIAAVNTAFCQIQKGQVMAGGNVGFSTTSQGGSSQTDVEFSPVAGYFFMDKLAGGLRIDLNSSSYGGSTSSDFLFAPFARYYFLPTAQKVNVFGDASVGFGSSKSGGTSVSSNAFQLMAGPSIFLTPNTAVDFSVLFRSVGYGTEGSSRANTFGLNVGFQVHLGGKK